MKKIIPIAILIMTCTVLLSACSEKDASSSGASKVSSQPVSQSMASASKKPKSLSKAESTSYPIGKAATINSSAGQYSVIINSVKESKSRNEVADSQPKKIILINYTFKNISCKQDLTVPSIYFHIYDGAGKLLDVYPSTEAKLPSHTISIGKNENASMAYGLDNNSTKIDIELYDAFNPLNKVATFSANISK